MWGLLLIFLSICMKFYDLGAFCNIRVYETSVNLSTKPEATSKQSKSQTAAQAAAEEAAQAAEQAAKSVTPDNAQKNLDKLKESQELKAVFNLEGVEADDIAIIALLTAFLTVAGGPGIALTAASLLLVAKTLRTHHIKVPNDDEIQQRIRPDPKIEDATAQQVIPQTKQSPGVA
jgi:hypothetical protein